MRIATVTLLLAVISTSSFTVGHVEARGASTKVGSIVGLRSHKRGPQPCQDQDQQLRPQPRSPWLRRVRGGGVAVPSPAVTAAAATAARDASFAGVRGGRSSDTAVLVEALAETALESGLIVGFVGAAAFLADRYVTPKFAEVARLALWTAAVFLSGAATAGPKRWLETSQLFNIDTPISNGWYAMLRKPSWNPPNWVFPIMWVPLKILQVFACYEMWEKLGERSCIAAPVVVYAVYKSLGDVWNKVFFERRRLKMGTVIISLYYGVLLIGIKLFMDVSPRAGYLFAPTAAWVTIATCLQWSTWLLNRNEPHA